jgi:Ser-tRNA(Ala) deacylase AlaX
MSNPHINFKPEGKHEWAVYIDGEYIGSRRSINEAEALANEYVTNQAELESRFITQEAA